MKHKVIILFIVLLLIPVILFAFVRKQENVNKSGPWKLVWARGNNELPNDITSDKRKLLFYSLLLNGGEEVEVNGERYISVKDHYSNELNYIKEDDLLRIDEENLISPINNNYNDYVPQAKLLSYQIQESEIAKNFEHGKFVSLNKNNIDFTINGEKYTARKEENVISVLKNGIEIWSYEINNDDFEIDNIDEMRIVNLDGDAEPNDIILRMSKWGCLNEFSQGSCEWLDDFPVLYFFKYDPQD